MSAPVALLPSPLLGPAMWRPVERALVARGWAATTARPPADAPRTVDDVLAGLLEALPRDRDVVVVAHSNAGLYVPALVRERAVVAALFVDAGLPVREGPIPLASAEFREFLRATADGQRLLPGWTHWWTDDDLDGLFGRGTGRADVEREQPRLPVSYFDGSMHAHAGWDDVPCGYLAFGQTYAAERLDAQTRGWPVATIEGGHLHPLVAPDQVAAAIAALLGELGIRAH
ncbi:MAG: alpha/beta hydrolase [Cellulomonas sp.]